VPLDNIERAIAKASQAAEALEELLFEAYGPGGIAMLIEAVTDNRNRTVQEVKKILGDHNAKWATPGSVQWAFELRAGEEGAGWEPKFPAEASAQDAEALRALVAATEDHDDVQRVSVNTAL